MYPLETILCGGLLIWFRYEYNFRRLRKIVFTILVRPLIFAVWISQFLGFPAGNAVVLFYRRTVGFRFLRLVIGLPLIGKIFGADFCCAF
jgi:hypothetical protein